MHTGLIWLTKAEMGFSTIPSRSTIGKELVRMAPRDLHFMPYALRQTLVLISSLRTLTCGRSQAAPSITNVLMLGVQVIASMEEHNTLSMVL